MVCILCETNAVENWFGSFCKDCRQIKNLGNVYGFPRTLPEEIESQLTDSNELYEKPKTRKNKSK